MNKELIIVNNKVYLSNIELVIKFELIKIDKNIEIKNSQKIEKIKIILE